MGVVGCGEFFRQGTEPLGPALSHASLICSTTPRSAPSPGGASLSLRERPVLLPPAKGERDVPSTRIIQGIEISQIRGCLRLICRKRHVAAGSRASAAHAAVMA